MATAKTDWSITIKCEDIVDLKYDDESLMIEDQSKILSPPIIERSETGNWLIKFSYNCEPSKIVNDSFARNFGHVSRLYAVQAVENVGMAPQGGILYFSIICFFDNGAASELDIFIGRYYNDCLWIGSQNILNYKYIDEKTKQNINYCLFMVIPPGTQKSKTLDIYKIDSSNTYPYAKRAEQIAAILDLRRQF